MEAKKPSRGRPKGVKDTKPRKPRVPPVRRAIVAIERESPVITGPDARVVMATYVELGSGWDKRNALRGLQAQTALAIGASLDKPDFPAYRDSLCHTLEVLHRLELEDFANAPAGAVDITPPSQAKPNGVNGHANPVSLAPFVRKVG